MKSTLGFIIFVLVLVGLLFFLGYCQKSLAYDPNDPYAHYALALCYARLAQANGSLETLSAAAKHFRAMLDLNGDIEEAQYARANLKSIEPLLAAR